MEAKETDPHFAGDMEGLLRPGFNYNQHEAFEWLKAAIVERM